MDPKMLNYKRSAFQSICEPVTFSGLSYYWIKFVPTSCIDSVYSKDVHDIFLSRYIEFSLCYCPLMKFLGFYTPTNEVGGGGVTLDSPCPSICPSVRLCITKSCFFFFPRVMALYCIYHYSSQYRSLLVNSL